MPIRKVLSQGRVPVKIYTDEIADNAQAQLANIATLPFIHHHVAAMPDVHLGIGATVGSVIATRQAIVPAAVGVDIGCGMIAVRTGLVRDDLAGKALSRLREAIDANLSKWAHREFDPDLAMLTVCGMSMFIALHNRFGSTPTGEPDEIAPELLSIIWDGLRARD